MKVLNGQRGPIGDVDDIEEILEGDEVEDIDTLDDTQRSVKLMLRSKLIDFVYIVR
jgi:hypothetical protein